MFILVAKNVLQAMQITTVYSSNQMHSPVTFEISFMFWWLPIAIIVTLYSLFYGYKASCSNFVLYHKI